MFRRKYFSSVFCASRSICRGWILSRHRNTSANELPMTLPFGSTSASVRIALAVAEAPRTSVMWLLRLSKRVCFIPALETASQSLKASRSMVCRISFGVLDRLSFLLFFEYGLPTLISSSPYLLFTLEESRTGTRIGFPDFASSASRASVSGVTLCCLVFSV